MEIKVDVSGSLHSINMLKNINKRAFPNTMKYSLNDVAFETKKNIPEVAEKNFTIRQKNLFKSHTGVNKVKSNNISSMNSSVGLLANRRISDNLAKQETGGRIMKRSFIALDSARISKSNKKKISKPNFLKNAQIQKGSKYFIQRSNNKQFLFKKTGKKKITPVYSFKKNRSVSIKGSPFLKPASEKAMKNFFFIFEKNAIRQIRKYTT